jgi:hypothetical protein
MKLKIQDYIDLYHPNVYISEKRYRWYEK